MPDFEVIALNITKLSCKPGDTLVISLPVGTDPLTVRSVEEYTRARIPVGVQMMVISDAVKLSVIEKAAPVVESVLIKSKKKG